jgi:hypothetical protein
VVIVGEHSLWGSSLLVEIPLVELLLSLRNRQVLRHRASLARRRSGSANRARRVPPLSGSAQLAGRSDAGP